jgi:hypothetical protein
MPGVKAQACNSKTGIRGIDLKVNLNMANVIL